MAAFDLERFRGIAFGRRALPDHPMRDVASATRLLQLLPEDDPDTAIADLTHWAVGLNRAPDFTPGRRARVFMLLDDAARPVWRMLGQRYLAPEGRPLEKGEGDLRILRALHDSAFEFASGFAQCLEGEARKSRWIAANLPRLAIRRLRWLGRRLALGHMLHVPVGDALWEELHRAYRDAAEEGYLQTAVSAYEGGNYRTSLRREYVRALLLDLAHPSGMRPREVELAYRIAARIANTVQLTDERTTESAYAVVPELASRPAFVGLAAAGDETPRLYLSTALALPRLREFLERDRGRDAGEEDTLFGRGFTLRERQALIGRLIDFWGFDPPRRRMRRIRMSSPARLVVGFDRIVSVLAGAFEDQMAGDQREKIRLKLNHTSKSLRKNALRAAREWRGQVVDASTGGLGLAVNAKTAPPLRQGELVGVLIEPSKAWTLGVLRRIYASGEDLRLGIQVLSLRPSTLWIETDLLHRESVWEDAMKHESLFGEHFRRAILLEPCSAPLEGGELMLPPGLASRGTRFGVPLSTGHQQIRIDRLLADTEDYQRAAFEAAPPGKT